MPGQAPRHLPLPHHHQGTEIQVPHVNVGVNVPVLSTPTPHLAETPTEQENHRQAHPTIVDLVVRAGPAQADEVVAAREVVQGTGHNPDIVGPSGVTYC